MGSAFSLNDLNLLMYSEGKCEYMPNEVFPNIFKDNPPRHFITITDIISFQYF